jgi:hypothetical protein
MQDNGGSGGIRAAISADQVLSATPRPKMCALNVHLLFDR